MPNANIPNRSLHASYENIARNLFGGITFSPDGIAANVVDAATSALLTQNGYAIDRFFNDPVTDFQAVGLRSTDPTKPPLLVLNGTSSALDETDNRNPQGAGFGQFTANRAAISSWLTTIAADAVNNPQLLFPDVTGHSYGGAVAQLTAAAFPLLISEVVTFEAFGQNAGITTTFTQGGGVAAQVTHYVNSGDIVPLQGQELLAGAAVLATYDTPAIDPQNFGQKHFDSIVGLVPNSATTQPANVTYQEIGTAALNNPNFTYTNRDWTDFILALRQADPQLAQSLSNRQSAEGLRTQLSYFQLANRINQLDLAAGYTAATRSGLRTNPGTNILEVTSTTANQAIGFTSVSRTGNLANEIGLFRVDDDLGTVNGIAPGATGYLEAALNRSQVVFSSLTGNFFDANSQRRISFNPGERFQLYSVQNSTTDQARQNLSSGQALPRILFSTPAANGGITTNARVSPNGNNLTVGWNDGTDAIGNYQDLVLNVQQLTTPAPLGSGLQGGVAGEVLDLRNLTGSVQVSTTIRSAASYNNDVGLYRVDDETGLIGTLRPTDAGYAQAALSRAVLTLNKTQTTAQSQVAGGSLYASFLVANGTVQDFLSRNASNASGTNVPNAYFNYVGANPDRVDHVRLLGDNKFGFEDLFGGGDLDYNDIVVQFNVNQSTIG